jgi:hypothetical protein
MKRVVKATLVVITTTLSAWSGPLQREQVSAQAKWVLHLDAEKFRTSKLGQYYIENFLEKQISDAQTTLGLDLGPFLHSLKSATIYGMRVGQGADSEAVLLMQSDPDAVGDIENYLVTHSTKGKKSKLRQIQTEPFALFKLDQLFAAPLTNGMVLLSKSQHGVRTAWDVLNGKEENAVTAKRFTELSSGTNNVILAAGLDGVGEDTPLPPNAKIFRKVEYARVMLGERGEQMFLNISLKTTSTELAMQMRLVVEGLIAWGAIEKGDDQNLQLLVKSAKVTASDQVVSASFELPSAKVLEVAKQGREPKTVK